MKRILHVFQCAETHANALLEALTDNVQFVEADIAVAAAVEDFLPRPYPPLASTN